MATPFSSSPTMNASRNSVFHREYFSNLSLFALILPTGGCNLLSRLSTPFSPLFPAPLVHLPCPRLDGRSPCRPTFKSFAGGRSLSPPLAPLKHTSIQWKRVSRPGKPSSIVWKPVSLRAPLPLPSLPIRVLPAPVPSGAPPPPSRRLLSSPCTPPSMRGNVAARQQGGVPPTPLSLFMAPPPRAITRRCAEMPAPRPRQA